MLSTCWEVLARAVINEFFAVLLEKVPLFEELPISLLGISDAELDVFHLIFVVLAARMLLFTLDFLPPSLLNLGLGTRFGGFNCALHVL